MRKANTFGLSDAQISQLEQMVAYGDKPKEIIQFFKDKHQVKIPAAKIYYLQKALKKGSSGKRRYSTETVKPTKPTMTEDSKSIESLMSECFQIMKDTNEAYKAIILALRLELIKNCNELFKVRAGLKTEGGGKS